MLTREQKIDFLKCCIAAYESKELKAHLKGVKSSVYPENYENSMLFGFCHAIDHYFSIILGDEDSTTGLEYTFIEFHNFLQDKRGVGNFYWPINKDGYKTRAKLAREFLKSEYGIEVK